MAKIKKNHPLGAWRIIRISKWSVSQQPSVTTIYKPCISAIWKGSNPTRSLGGLSTMVASYLLHLMILQPGSLVHHENSLLPGLHSGLQRLGGIVTHRDSTIVKVRVLTPPFVSTVLNVHPKETHSLLEPDGIPSVYTWLATDWMMNQIFV